MLNLMRCTVVTLLLVAAGACIGDRPPTPDVDAAVATCADPGDGYDAPPLTGPRFLFQRFELPVAVAGAACRGALDLTGDDVPDSRLNASYTLSRAITMFLEHGDYYRRQLFAVEVAGLCAAAQRDDPTVTAKFYRVLPCDLNRADNFCHGRGCGQVLVSSSDLAGQQAVNRWSPVPLVGGQLQTAIGCDIRLVEIEFPPLPSPPPLTLTLRRARLTISLAATSDQAVQGLTCGAVALPELRAVQVVEQNGAVQAEYATSAADSLAVDLIRQVDGAGIPFQPDVDLDGDGLERYGFDDNGHLVCFDGGGQPVGGSSCLDDVAMADGYSACFTFVALLADLSLGTCTDGG